MGVHFILVPAFILATGCIVNELMRRNPNLVWLIYFLFPVGLLPFWIAHSKLDWFILTKIFALTSGICLINWMRAKQQRMIAWGFLAVNILFGLNILLAGWDEGVLCYFPCLLNALTGLFLVAMLPPVRCCSIDQHRFHDFLWDASYNWIFGYTAWNLLFSYIAYPECLIINISMLAYPLIVAYFNRKLWLQARFHSLAFYFILRACFPSVQNYQLPYPEPHLMIVTLLAALCAAWMFLSFVYLFWKKSPNLWIKPNGSQSWRAHDL